MPELQFYKIESINQGPNIQTYDISVNNNANFIANGLVVHNCYEEQIMQIGREIGRFDPSQLNRFRKFLKEGQKIIISNKRKYNKLRKEFYDQFIHEGLAQELDGDELERLWQMMVKFSQYSFNKCIDESSIIETKEGNKKIKDVSVGDYVKCSNGFYEVVDVIDSGNKDCVEIETESGKTLICTLDHKIMTEEGMLPLKEILKRNLSVYVNACI